MNTLPNPVQCGCDTCDEPVLVQVPGPAATPAQPGTDGAPGQNAYTTLAANFQMPAELASGIATVVNSDWITINQKLSLNGSTLQATAIDEDGISVTLKNLENAAASAYADNAAAGTIFATGSKLSPGGDQGPSGPAPGGALLAASNLSDVASTATARTNLGLGTVATQAAGTVAFTGGAVGILSNIASAAQIRTDLALVPGANVQAYDAELAALAGLISATDKLPYFTGLGAAALTDLTAAARALLDDATLLAQRATLEVLPRAGLLGMLVGATFNSTVDQAIAISGSTRYIIRRIIVSNVSLSMTTAAGGIYTGAGKSGTIIVAAGQGYGTLTGAAKFKDLTLEPVVGTDVLTAPVLYLSLTTPQGAAATGDIYIFGEHLG